jgi:VanZ family protein
MKLKRILIFLLLACMLFLTFQSPEGTVRLSRSLQSFMMRLLGVELTDSSPPRWAVDMPWFRTLLHLPEYFVLGLAVGLYGRGRRRALWTAAAFCAAFALLDESIKLLLPTREFGALDLCFDILASLAAVALVYALARPRAKEGGNP